MTPERLAEIRERAEAATPGPWTVDPYWSANDHSGYAVEPVDDSEGGISPVDCEREADAEFIAHARTDVPDLLAEVERLRQVIADEVNALQFEWRIEGDVVSREKAKRLAAALNPTEGETDE